MVRVRDRARARVRVRVSIRVRVRVKTTFALGGGAVVSWDMDIGGPLTGAMFFNGHA